MCRKGSQACESRLGGLLFFFFQAEDGIRDLVRSRGLGDVYKRQTLVMFRDGSEVGRIVAGTREADIRALLDTGL